MKKTMVCVDCGMRLHATIVQAKAHGWALWVGGARCKACGERLSRAAEREVKP
jgi:hypothetical protein